VRKLDARILGATLTVHTTMYAGPEVAAKFETETESDQELTN